MQKIFYSSDVKKKIEQGFNGEREAVPKNEPRFPVSAEREYNRLVNAYMRTVKKAIEKEWPAVQREYVRLSRVRNDDMRMDSIFDIMSIVDDFGVKVLKRLTNGKLSAALLKHLRKIGQITKKTEISEWKKLIHGLFGVDLSTDYFSGDFYEAMLEEWVSRNVDLIVTVPHDMLDEMKEVVLEAYRQGKPVSTLQKEILERYDMSRSHARLIARDQMGKLNAEITRKEHEDAGVTKYRWSSSQDERVRDCHAEFDGKVFEYSNPPEAWYWTKAGKKYTGRFCNPGEDYQCRCVALPVFDFDRVEIPVEDGEGKKHGIR